MCGSEWHPEVLQGTASAPRREYWAQVYRECYEEVRRYFLRYIKCPHDADDLVQCVFLRVLMYNCSPRYPHTYIHTVARHLLFSYLRHQKRRKHLLTGRAVFDDSSELGEPAPCSDRDSDPLERLSENEMAGIVVSTLSGLSPILAEALRLRFLSGLHLNEAASRAGCSRETLKKRLKRAKQSLIESWSCGEGFHDG